MIRQQSQQQQQRRGSSNMMAPPNINRIVMTAPRPRLHRLLSEEEESSSSTTGSDPDEDIIHKNLFAQPTVVQNDIFRHRLMGVANNHHDQHQIYQQPINPAHHGGGGGGSGATQYQQQHHHHHQQHYRSIHRTPSKERGTARGMATNGRKVKRTGSDHFCGLTAEISQEISSGYYSRGGTPIMKTPTMKTPMKTPGKGIMAPLSRDLFRSKQMAVPMTDSKITDLRWNNTASMSGSSDTDGVSSMGVGDLATSMMNVPQQQRIQLDLNTAASTKKKKQHKKDRDNRRKSMGCGIIPSTTNNATTTIKPVAAVPPPKTPKPEAKKARIRKTPFSALSARKRIKKCLTPPRKNFGSHSQKGPSSQTTSPRRMSTAAAMTLSTAYTGVDDFRLTSSEVDPSPFQMELPTKKEIGVHSKICALMDGYTAIHRDFNFAMLSGVSHSTLRKEVARSTDEKPMIAGSCHRDVVKKLLDCAEDIVVEGFFREYTESEEGDNSEGERMEAVILSSESLRQIIVCFRGSTANQAKPLGKSGYFGKEATSILHEEHPVPVLASFRTTYFGTPIERTVFALLANLGARKPFFDVAMTGHSYGAAMATIAALRYSLSNSQMRVSCHVFGSPRVGGEEWRQMVHSVSNLRVYRVENGVDPFVLLPAGNEWIHCGHAIQILGDDCDVAEFKARRFDRDRDSSGGVSSNNTNLLGYVQAKVGSIAYPQGSSSQGRVDHEIQSYDEKLTGSGDEWFSDFCEMKGDGIRANNERRMLA
mmetsp:Transcript_26087/g.54438  ORF Transcript_26087/g.54438 Transcript_26087/m.54438 type:complete len:761 (+) Transcript_26087:109-2391(+)